MDAVALENFCSKSYDILVIVGWVLTIFKIAIPLIIVGIGIFDLARAAISTKPEDIKKSTTSLIWRLIGGVAIFILPGLILMLFGWINDFSEATKKIDFHKCKSYLLCPWEGEEGCYPEAK